MLAVTDDVWLHCDCTGPVALSTACQLISPGACVYGTISITKTELYFEMDEDDTRNKKIDSKVCCCAKASGLLCSLYCLQLASSYSLSTCDILPFCR